MSDAHGFITRSGREYVALGRPGAIPDDAAVRLIGGNWEVPACLMRQRRDLRALCAALPPSSCSRNSRQVRSRETERTCRSSGLNAMRVTVRLWPASGCPKGRQCVVSYTRITACSAEVALHAVATSRLEWETESVMDCTSVRTFHLTADEQVALHIHVRKSSPLPAKG